MLSYGTVSEWIAGMWTDAFAISVLPHPGQNGLSKTFISLIVTGVLIVVLLVAMVITLLECQRKRRLADFNKPRETVLNPIYPFIPPAEMNIPYDPRWEFPRSKWVSCYWWEIILFVLFLLVCICVSIWGVGEIFLLYDSMHMCVCVCVWVYAWR